MGTHTHRNHITLLRLFLILLPPISLSQNKNSTPPSHPSPPHIPSLRVQLGTTITMDPSQQNPLCYLHPKELIVGVCALCLKERLLILAANQRPRRRRPQFKDTHRPFALLRRKSAIIFPRVFALGSTLLHRRETSQTQRPKDSQTQRPKDDDSDDDDDQGSISSLEDSFISIKFENNGHVSWDNKKPIARDEPSMSKSFDGGGGSAKSIVEHTKVLRWRKRVGQLLQMARWKRPSKAGASCHVGLVEGVKFRRGGWIRSLTHRTTTSATG